MGTVSDLVTEITANVDTSPADALTVLDRRHKLMCARARWYRLQQTLTAATATDATYSTLEGPTVVEVFWITATVNGRVGDFRPTNYTDRGAIMDGTLRVRGRGGVFLQDDETDPTDTTPDTQWLIYPALEDGSDVLVDGAFRPPTLTIAETSGGFIRVDDEYREGLLAGVYASIISRPGDARLDLAASYEQAFSAACGELRDRADRRYRTRGPRQIRVPSRDC